MTTVMEKPKRKRVSTSRQRRLVEKTIERLVELLDEIDGDPDDEPSLGSVSCVGRLGYPHYGFARDFYGWDQTGWAAGRRDDVEEEHDGREPQGDEEPDQYSKPPKGYVGFNPMNGLPIVEDCS